MQSVATVGNLPILAASQFTTSFGNASYSVPAIPGAPGAPTGASAAASSGAGTTTLPALVTSAQSALLPSLALRLRRRSRELAGRDALALRVALAGRDGHRLALAFTNVVVQPGATVVTAQASQARRRRASAQRRSRRRPATRIRRSIVVEFEPMERLGASAAHRRRRGGYRCLRAATTVQLCRKRGNHFARRAKGDECERGYCGSKRDEGATGDRKGLSGHRLSNIEQPSRVHEAADLERFPHVDRGHLDHRRRDALLSCAPGAMRSSC